MKPIYAFFDECGEEGFAGKASEWFILSASIQASEDLETVREHHASFRAAHRHPDDWHFHFVKSSHRHRLAFIRHMLPAGYVFMSVAVHKASITQTDNFKRPYYLYFYAAKLLLERISWLARAQGRHLHHLYFSSRRGLKREDVAAYLRLLRNKEAGLSNSIYWPALRGMGIDVLPNKEKIGLQMADLMASSVGQAISPHPYGVTEPRYVLELKSRIYDRKGSKLSYGLKFFPNLSQQMREEERFAWLPEFER